MMKTICSIKLDTITKIVFFCGGKMLEKVVGIVFIIMMALFCYGSMVVSSKCSRWEAELYEELEDEEDKS